MKVRINKCLCHRTTKCKLSKVSCHLNYYNVKVIEKGNCVTVLLALKFNYYHVKIIEKGNCVTVLLALKFNYYNVKIIEKGSHV